MSHLNIEIKARCANPEAAREVLQAANAEFRGIDEQIDTCFQVKTGRLKLRAGKIENSLIYYDRPNEPGPKRAEVSLCRLSPDSGLREALAASLGILVEVRKRREIYFIENVKFHIDQVEELGEFLEIEALDIYGTIREDHLLSQCRTCMQRLGIKEEDLIECSYSDMLLARNR